MIDFTYAENKTYDFTGETITIEAVGGTVTYTCLSGDNSYLDHLEDFLAYTAGGIFTISMDTEFIKIVHNYSANILSITCSDLDLAYLLGLNALVIGSINNNTYYFPAWGFKLPRTTVHELASLQGGFIVEKEVKDLYRQRETKVTKNKTYSTNFTVRRGITYNYRLDERYIGQFDIILAEWMDEVITSTSDWGIKNGTCVSNNSGIRTLVYPDQEIYKITLTLLGEASGKD